jgi:hypothetical protein
MLSDSININIIIGDLMNLNEITDKLAKVSDIYAEKFQIRRDDDWFVKHKGVDVEQAIKDKWFQYLPDSNK